MSDQFNNTDDLQTQLEEPRQAQASQGGGGVLMALCVFVLTVAVVCGYGRLDQIGELIQKRRAVAATKRQKDGGIWSWVQGLDKNAEKRKRDRQFEKAMKDDDYIESMRANGYDVDWVAY